MKKGISVGPVLVLALVLVGLASRATPRGVQRDEVRAATPHGTAALVRRDALAKPLPVVGGRPA